MILVLTYHKVAGSAGQDDDFYTVTEEQFQRQLDLVAEQGFQFVAPRALLEIATEAGKAGGSTGRRMALLTFDDGTEDHHKVVLPLLEKRGCKAVFFVPTTKIGRAGYLTSRQVADIASAGHEIGCHSHDHKRMDRMPEQEIRMQLTMSMDKLAATTGGRPVYFAPPGGYISKRLKVAALDLGLRVIRTMRWGYNTPDDLTDLDCVPLNRHVSEKEFRNVLNLRATPLVYSAKELVKAIVPMKVYEAMRRTAFKSRRNG